MTEIERLTRMVLDWPSPHVRRHAHRIGAILARFNELGIPWRTDARQIIVGSNSEYLGTYDHPHRAPRQRGILAFRETALGTPLKWRTNKIVYEIDTEEDLAFFLLSPKRWLTKL